MSQEKLLQALQQSYPHLSVSMWTIEAAITDGFDPTIDGIVEFLMMSGNIE